DPAIVLIMGLATQMIAWPESFCEGLASEGFRVVRFDNRDNGLSDKFHHARPPNIPLALLRARMGLPLSVPYTLRDMADDTLGLLDALSIEQAHVVGVSMGGMIGQLVTALYPQRVQSFTSIMSSSGDRKLPAASAKVSAAMLRRPRLGEQAYIEHRLKVSELIGSPAFRPHPEELKEKILRSFRRSYYPEGALRQMAAIVESGSRVKLLQSICRPTLVIHGKHDLLVPVEAGIDTARHISGARLKLFDGMGHDLPAPLLPRFTSLISEHASAAQ
ncbi:MAG: alpha/beta fold hydrolase, partial [Gammaproteobacteria bacterium]|nr:alpha/beta fold hydrolase [Gammaproteobacteria bacterium]